MLSQQLNRTQVLSGTRNTSPYRVCRTRKYYVIRSHSDDDDDVLPILRLPKEITAHDIEKLPRNPAFKGATTIGEKLTAIHQQYKLQERNAMSAMEEDLYSENWQGGVYVGKTWNIMTIILLLSAMVPIAGLLFAYFTYGRLWGTVGYY
eukprot:TRINITY_DN1252_c0_g1_i1.p3 TRINITY_DN1252_c0_g1~~TRINITY_DN1252_c0_g1_i1.p3  ORF type:complete len:149 (-),score=8.21 TRINITY_DN1252_c0_g1_i1:1225-1671(-)